MELPSSTLGRIALVLIVILVILPVTGFTTYITLPFVIVLVIALTIRHCYQKQAESSGS